MRIGPAVGFLVITTVIALHSGVAEAACKDPDPEVLINHQVMGFKWWGMTPLRSSGAPLRWVSVSGTAMRQGEVFVVDCRGAKLAELGLGAVGVQKLGPMVMGRPSLIVTYDSDSGTNINVQDVALLQYRDGVITKLWDHDSFNGQYPPEGLGRQEETIYRWRFTHDSQRIEVTGRHVVYREQNSNGPLHKSHISYVRRLRQENFCLDRRRMKYKRCI